MTTFQALAVLNLLVAAIQTGFGPFLNLALTGQGWSLTELGVALSIGTVAALACQMPGGALVDAVHRKRLVLAAAIGVTGLAAVLLGSSMRLVPVLAAEILHAAAATVITPAIAAVTLTVCSRGTFGERLGSNTKWASLGSAGAAILLGPLASYLGARLVFPLTTALCLAAALVALQIRPTTDGSTAGAHAALMHPEERRRRGLRFWTVYTETDLHWFALCTLLFHMANGAMLPLALNVLATRSAREAELTTSAAILVSQIVVAILSHRLGRDAERRGRRPLLLLLGFAMLPVRGLMLAILPGVVPLVGAQMLDGISGAVMGIAIPLIAADLTGRTGFLNLAIGSLGLAAGLGATVSTLVGGWIADRAGTQAALLLLSVIGVCAFTLLRLAMPETQTSGAPFSPSGAVHSGAAAPDSARSRT